MNSDSSPITPDARQRNAPERQRLLIVDDEPAILFAYQKLLAREGYQVDLCETPDRSMQLILKYIYFAVITDMRFGGTDNEDGVNILRFIHENRPDTKVILISGYRNDTIEQAELDRYAAYSFKKPVQPSALLNALKNLNTSRAT